MHWPIPCYTDKRVMDAWNSGLSRPTIADGDWSFWHDLLRGYGYVEHHHYENRVPFDQSCWWWKWGCERPWKE